MHLLRLVEQGGLSFKESFIGLFRNGRHLVVLVVERIKRVKMTCLDDVKIEERYEMDVALHDHFEVVEFVSREEGLMTRSNNVIKCIVQDCGNVSMDVVDKTV
ncbi:hypothetical protein Tco_0573467 [Tanacetum coccineum]